MLPQVIIFVDKCIVESDFKVKTSPINPSSKGLLHKLVNTCTCTCM